MVDQAKIDWDFHRLSHEELCKRFKTNTKTGLTSDQALERNTLYGANTVASPPTTSEWKKLWSCLLSSHSVPMLCLGAVPCFVAYSKGFGINNLYIGAGLSSVVSVAGIYLTSVVSVAGIYLCKRSKTNTKTVEHNTLYGPNTVASPPTTSEWKKLWNCLLNSHSVPMLCLGAVPCFVAYSKGSGINNLYIGAGLTSVVSVAGIYSYYQQFKSNQIIESIKALVPQYAVCLRNGEKQHVKREDLTLGDIVELNRGDIIPADIVIIESSGLKVDNSKFTPAEERFRHEDHCMVTCYVCSQARSPEFTHTSHLETKNVVFCSTRVVEGSGTGMVVKIGDDTELAKIPDIPRSTDADTAIGVEIPWEYNKRWFTDTDVAREKRATDNKRDTDNKRVNRFIFLVSSVTISVGGGLSILAQNYRWLYPVIFGIHLIPTIMYASYNAAIRAAYSRLASCNCLVKDMDALKKLSSFSSMYTNITGTLTQNRMSVNHIWLNNEIICLNSASTTVPHVDLSPQYGTHLVELDFWNENEWPMSKTSSWKALERAAVLCNNAEFMPGQEGIPTMKKEVMGNTTDAAILKVTEHTNGGGVMEYRAKYEKVRELAFNSERKLQLTFHRSEELDEHELLVVVKGAPEQILRACSTTFIDDIEYPIEKGNRKSANYEFAGGYGERVIAFCDIILDTRLKSDSLMDLNMESPLLDEYIADQGLWVMGKGFRFLGLMSLIDPPRAAVQDTIAQLKHANKKVIIVTGAELMMANRFARSIGVMTEDTVADIAYKRGVKEEDIDPREAQAACITGNEFRYLMCEQWDDILTKHKEILCARMDPVQKQYVIQRAKNLGEVVAFTGSNFGDILALEEADLGITMGSSGSDSIKNSADITLLDDHFGSIVRGMNETKNLF